MFRSFMVPMAALALTGIAGCGMGGSSSAAVGAGAAGGTSTPQRGQLINSSLVATYNTAQLLTLLGADSMGQLLLTLDYSPTCSVSVYHIEYGTVGGRSEATTASAAVMVPAGSSCQGARPIVEYAHGTSPDKTYNIAVLSGNSGSSEGLLLAAVFASQGYTVVAPNYAGYDTSTLTYHPYLVAAQQADDMMDAVAAARSALPTLNTGVTDNGKLYVTGYSQGGYVAMAAVRAMQAAGESISAAGPMSGPYALAALGDAILMGEVNGSATLNIGMLANGYQNTYGNLYSQASDLFASPYDGSVPGLLPSSTSISQIYSQNLLPQNALFSSTPPAAQYASMTPANTPADLAVVFAQGVAASNYLITNSYRLSYLQDEQANPDGGFPSLTSGVTAASPGNALRQDLKTNDLRNWGPTFPLLLCAGQRDPVVFFFDTTLLQNYWAANPPAGPVTVLDIDSAPTANDSYVDEKDGFAAAAAAVEADAVVSGATDGGEAALLASYHTPLVPAFCLWSVKTFFDAH